MREILFRAKKNYKNVGEWVVGLVAQPHVTEDGIVTSYYFTALKENGYSSQTTVSANTIGQYTGLTDKNGKKIFEGDICSKFSNYTGKKIYFPIVFEQGLFYAKYSETAGMPLCDICEKIEVVGNIHDNPELLEAGKSVSLIDGHIDE